MKDRNESEHRLDHGSPYVLRLGNERGQWWGRLESDPGSGEALASKGGPCGSQQLRWLVQGGMGLSTRAPRRPRHGKQPDHVSVGHSSDVLHVDALDVDVPVLLIPI